MYGISVYTLYGIRYIYIIFLQNVLTPVVFSSPPFLFFCRGQNLEACSARVTSLLFINSNIVIIIVIIIIIINTGASLENTDP